VTELAELADHNAEGAAGRAAAAPPAGGAHTGPTRLDRRKARTHRALLEAARAIIAERGTTEVSIQEITDRADVGFGSFYNHFASKSELFRAAVGEVLEAHGQLLDQVIVGIDDPAEVFAVSVRATAALAENQPAMAQVLVHAGLEYLLAADGLAPRALRDVERAVEAGRFMVTTPFLAVASTTGCLLAYLQVRLHAPQLFGHETVDDLAEQLLRMFGVAPGAAHEIAHRPMPGLLDTTRPR